jgi:hypothetical protein
MRSKASFIAAVSMMLALFATAQKNNFPTPPPSMDTDHPQSDQPPTPTRHVDYAQVEREADNLARMAQTIPVDVASVRKGMLPKDVMAKLKQIEKLSKHLRSQLNP